MRIFCIQEFKDEFEKLKSKKAYQTLEKDLISYFFDKSVSELSSGIRLNNSAETPFIKKRLLGSGGYRFYYLLIIRNDDLYLMFVHPKTGPFGSENITDQSKAFLYKRVLFSIKNNDLYHLSLNDSKSRIIFIK